MRIVEAVLLGGQAAGTAALLQALPPQLQALAAPMATMGGLVTPAEEAGNPPHPLDIPV